LGDWIFNNTLVTYIIELKVGWVMSE